MPMPISSTAAAQSSASAPRAAPARNNADESVRLRDIMRFSANGVEDTVERIAKRQPDRAASLLGYPAQALGAMAAFGAATLLGKRGHDRDRFTSYGMLAAGLPALLTGYAVDQVLDRVSKPTARPGEGAANRQQALIALALAPMVLASSPLHVGGNK